MASGSSIFEEQGVGVPQVQQHHGVRNADVGHIDTRFRDDGGRFFASFFLGRRFFGCEDRVGGFFFLGGMGHLLMPVLQTTLVATQLLLDLLGSLIESDVLSVTVQITWSGFEISTSWST